MTTELPGGFYVEMDLDGLNKFTEYIRSNPVHKRYKQIGDQLEMEEILQNGDRVEIAKLITEYRMCEYKLFTISQKWCEENLEEKQPWEQD